MHEVVLLDRLVLIVGVLVNGGRCNWCRIVLWITKMSSIISVWMVNMRVVGIDLVDARGILVVLYNMRNGCCMVNNFVHYLMANRVRIGWVSVLMQVLHMFFIRPVRATNVIVFYELLFIMHLVCWVVLVFMRLKLLHPSGCLMRLLFRMCLYVLCFVLQLHEVLVQRMQGITRMSQYSVVINWVQIFD